MSKAKKPPEDFTDIKIIEPKNNDCNSACKTEARKMVEVEGNLEVVLDEKMETDIDIKVKGATISVRINPKRVYAILYNMEMVLGGLNAALKQTLKSHLYQMMMNEQQT